MTFTLPVSATNPKIATKGGLEAAVNAAIGAVAASGVTGFPYFADTTLGLAGTVDGEGFTTSDGASLFFYMNNGGVADLLAEVGTPLADSRIDAVEADLLTLNGRVMGSFTEAESTEFGDFVEVVWVKFDGLLLAFEPDDSGTCWEDAAGKTFSPLKSLPTFIQHWKVATHTTKELSRSAVNTMTDDQRISHQSALENAHLQTEGELILNGWVEVLDRVIVGPRCVPNLIDGIAGETLSCGLFVTSRFNLSAPAVVQGGTTGDGSYAPYIKALSVACDQSAAETAGQAAYDPEMVGSAAAGQAAYDTAIANDPANVLAAEAARVAAIAPFIASAVAASNVSFAAALIDYPAPFVGKEAFGVVESMRITGMSKPATWQAPDFGVSNDDNVGGWEVKNLQLSGVGMDLLVENGFHFFKLGRVDDWIWDLGPRAQNYRNREVTSGVRRLAMRFGRLDSLIADYIGIFGGGRIEIDKGINDVITDQIGSIQLDGDYSSLNLGKGRTTVGSIYGTENVANPGELNKIHVTDGVHRISNGSLVGDADALIHVEDKGRLTYTGELRQTSNTRHAALVEGDATLILENCHFIILDANWQVGFIEQRDNAVLKIKDCSASVRTVVDGVPVYTPIDVWRLVKYAGPHNTGNHMDVYPRDRAGMIEAIAGTDEFKIDIQGNRVYNIDGVRYRGNQTAVADPELPGLELLDAAQTVGFTNTDISFSVLATAEAAGDFSGSIDGTTIGSSTVSWHRLLGATDIPGLPNWVPAGTPNFLHFGAVGDCSGVGVGTDDSAAINNALAWVMANDYGTLEDAPSGNYRWRVASTLDCRSNVGVIGTKITFHNPLTQDDGVDTAIDVRGIRHGDIAVRGYQGGVDADYTQADPAGGTELVSVQGCRKCKIHVEAIDYAGRALRTKLDNSPFKNSFHHITISTGDITTLGAGVRPVGQMGYFQGSSAWGTIDFGEAAWETYGSVFIGCVDINIKTLEAGSINATAPFTFNSCGSIQLDTVNMGDETGLATSMLFTNNCRRIGINKFFCVTPKTALVIENTDSSEYGIKIDYAETRECTEAAIILDNVDGADIFVASKGDYRSVEVKGNSTNINVELSAVNPAREAILIEGTASNVEVSGTITGASASSVDTYCAAKVTTLGSVFFNNLVTIGSGPLASFDLIADNNVVVNGGRFESGQFKDDTPAKEIFASRGLADTYAPAATEYQTRGLMVQAESAGDFKYMPDGTTVVAGGLRYKRLAGSTMFSDLGNWVVNDQAFADHWKENSTPGTTDMLSGIQAGLDAGYVVKLRGANAISGPFNTTVNHTGLIGDDPKRDYLIALASGFNSSDATETTQYFGEFNGVAKPIIKNFGCRWHDVTGRHCFAGIRVLSCVSPHVSGLFFKGFPTGRFVEAASNTGFPVFHNIEAEDCTNSVAYVGGTAVNMQTTVLEIDNNLIGGIESASCNVRDIRGSNLGQLGAANTLAGSSQSDVVNIQNGTGHSVFYIYGYNVGETLDLFCEGVMGGNIFGYALEGSVVKFIHGASRNTIHGIWGDVNDYQIVSFGDGNGGAHARATAHNRATGIHAKGVTATNAAAYTTALVRFDYTGAGYGCTDNYAELVSGNPGDGRYLCNAEAGGLRNQLVVGEFSSGTDGVIAGSGGLQINRILKTSLTATRSTVQSLPISVLTDIVFNTVSNDRHGEFSIVDGTYTEVLPRTYNVTAAVGFDNALVGYIEITVDGTAVARFQAATDTNDLQVSKRVTLAEGNELGVRLYQSSGVRNAVSTSSRTYLDIQEV